MSFIGYPVSVPCAGHAGLGLREAGPGDAPAIVAHLAGLDPSDRRMRFCATLTEADVAGATFGTELVADPFDAGRVILIRTDAGSVYALGNPVEDMTALTLAVDVAFLMGAP